MTDLIFNKVSSGKYQCSFISVEGAGFQVNQEKYGVIKVEAYLDDLNPLTLACVKAKNEIFELAIPDGFNVVVTTDYDAVGKFTS